MSLPAPNLDDRTFKDIVEEAKKKIPAQCPQWTDFNPSDPGMTLVELFAWMTEMILYRLNQVPEKNYIKFLELMGASLLPQQASKGYVVFQTAKRVQQSDLGMVREGTQVATKETSSGVISFETTSSFQLSSADIVQVFHSRYEATEDISQLKELQVCNEEQLKEQNEIAVLFPHDGINIGRQHHTGENPDENSGDHISSLYLVLSEPHIDTLLIRINQPEENYPQNFTWHILTASGWSSLPLVSDTTSGLSHTGAMRFAPSDDWEKKKYFSKSGYWLRLSLKVTEHSPEIFIKGIHLNAAEVIQAQSHFDERIGSSTGAPYQTFSLPSTDVLPQVEIAVFENGQQVHAENVSTSGGERNGQVEETGDWVRWTKVENFFRSTPTDRHYTLDTVNGRVVFGNGKRGRIPPSGTGNIKMAKYLTGGGKQGNVGKGAVSVLNSPVPHVRSVTNPEATAGGADQETIEEVKLRAPWMLKHRYRAVTEKDFEQLTLEASGEIAKAHCFGEEGGVKVVVIPKERPGRPHQKLLLNSALQRRVKSYLDERRLLTTKLSIQGPHYKAVYVMVDIVVIPEKFSVRREIEQQIVTELKEFFHPLRGGADNTGWPLGRSIHLSEIYYLLERVDGVDYVEAVGLFDHPRPWEKEHSLKKIQMREKYGEYYFPHMAHCSVSAGLHNENDKQNQVD